MVVDLRVPEREIKRVVETAVDASREVRPIFRYLATPVALAGYVLAAWRFGSDMGWTEEFFISKGLLSHWQVWVALGAGMQMTAAYLDRLRAAAPAPQKPAAVVATTTNAEPSFARS